MELLDSSDHSCQDTFQFCLLPVQLFAQQSLQEALHTVSLGPGPPTPAVAHHICLVRCHPVQKHARSTVLSACFQNQQVVLYQAALHRAYLHLCASTQCESMLVWLQFDARGL